MLNYNDQKFLNYAIRIVKKNLGKTAKNPCVACVIVKNGEIIATGITSEGGNPHAEINAINKVRDKNLLVGATLYVTLEPCCHKGQESCAYVIIRSKISRVVVAMSDPDSRVNGGGIKILQDAKIEVVEDALLNEAREINKGFLKAKTTNLPYISLKVAVSLDGKIATKSLDSKWISSEKSRQYAHYLRGINDAIMVGANTLNTDNPNLDCRIKGLESHSPKKIVISNSLKFAQNLSFFQNPNNLESFVITGENNSAEISEFLTLKNNIKPLFCKLMDDKIDLKDALQKLANEGINSILVEGGSLLITSLLQKNLIDEIIIVRSSKIIGNDGIPAFGDMNFLKITDAINSFKKVEIIDLEEDLVEIYKKCL